MKLPKEFKTTKEFNEKTNSIFLNAYRAKFGIHHKTASFVFRYFLRGAITGVAFMLVIGSTAVFADQQNVNPDHPLYPLKRSYESVNLALSKESEKPVVYLKYAERRFGEIREIKLQNKQHKNIPTLINDLREDLKKSFSTLENEPLEIKLTSENQSAMSRVSNVILATSSLEEDQPPTPANRKDNLRNNSKRESSAKAEKNIAKNKSICKSWRELIGSEFPEVRQLIENQPNFMQRFERGCSPIIQKVED
ncbi:MAG: DUF5667 domain-containing protein [Patescibacteria group bacterium]|nr:DUF5667 domain-containing protein [Patescibacteria group bacterium]